VIGDFLYTLTPRDAGAPAIIPFNVRGDQTVAATTVLQFWRPPQGMVAIIGAAVATGLAGAAQTLQSLVLEVEQPEGSNAINALAEVYPNAAAGQAQALNFSPGGLVIIDPRTQRLRARAIYSAGAAGNYCRLAASGVLVPIGTLQVPLYALAEDA
jgi:hypothetical protein